MADLKQLEFYMLRYVPYVVRDEFVNIGVLLFEPHANGFRFFDMRMTSDWRRVYCLDQDVDIEILQDLEPYIRMQLQRSQDIGSLPRKLEDSFANVVQISSPKVCLAAQPALELDNLCSIYLKEPRLESHPATAHPRSEHAMILAAIEQALIRAGMWGSRIKNIKAADYTKKIGDKLVFDFGYVIGPEVRFFQAVPLKTNINQLIAVNLAHRFPKVADCIHAVNRTRASLTAVVSDDLDHKNPDIEFALDTLRENNVHVATVTEMPAIADTTRHDLKASGR